MAKKLGGVPVNDSDTENNTNNTKKRRKSSSGKSKGWRKEDEAGANMGKVRKYILRIKNLF